MLIFNLLDIPGDVLSNRIAIGVIFFFLLVIFLYVTGLNRKILRKVTVEEYINTTARIKSIEFAPNGIITTTVDGTIVDWNDGAESMFGWKDREIIGKNLVTIMPEKYRDSHIRGMEQAKLRGSKTDKISMEIEGLRKDKSTFPLHIMISRWKDGPITYYTAILEDITEKVMQAEFNRVLLSIYIEAEEMSRYGAWKWNVISDKITLTEGFRKIWELEDGGHYDFHSLSDRIYFEDKANVDKVVQDAILNQTDYTVEFRIVGRNGKIKKLKSFVKLIVNKGTVEKLIGVLYEIPNTNEGST